MPASKRPAIRAQVTKPKGNRLVLTTTRQPPPPRNDKKRCLFLEVAGEIRNQIYIYLFDSTTIIELMPKQAAYRVPAVHGSRTLVAKVLPAQAHRAADLLNAPQPRVRHSNPLGKHPRGRGSKAATKTNWKTSAPGAALVLACKTFHRECTSFLYASAAFFFQSPNRLSNFLTKTPIHHLQHVTRLQLEHVTYGNPVDPTDVVWKKKHDDRWAAVCKAAVTALPHLTHLSIVLDVRECPLRFWPKEAWVKPLLSFTTLLSNIDPMTEESYLQHVSVQIRSVWLKKDMFGDAELTRACHALHYHFGKVVERKIWGWDDASAMRAYEELALTKEAKYRRFRDYLNLNPAW